MGGSSGGASAVVSMCRAAGGAVFPLDFASGRTVGLLRRDDTGEVRALSSRTLVGRAPTCAIAVPEPRLSSEHAALSFRDGGWWVRDLGSRNGTAVDGVPVASGAERRIGAQGTLELGGVRFTLVDEGPPRASARDLDGGALVVATGDVLLLPDEERPQCAVVPTDDGGWRVDGDGDGVRVVDREELAVGGRRYRLFLPTAVAPTVGAEAVSLVFRVSADEEHVGVELVAGERRFGLRPRSHLYLLLTLARARVAASNPSPGERGWVQRDELARMLRCDRTTVNVQIHRLRHELASHGVEGAASLLEGRGRTGHVRLATEAVEIVRDVG